MPWISALTKMPWRMIVDHAPTIVDAARKLYASSRRPRPGTEPGDRASRGVESLQRAIEQLEAREVEHAGLLADLAKQVQDMANALEVLRARVRWALIGASVAVAVAILTAVFAGW